MGGIVVTTVSDRLVIDHPLGQTQPSWAAAIIGGPALFLAGRARFEYVVFSHVSRSRVIGLLVLTAMAPAMVLVPPLVAAIATNLVLIGVAAADVVGWRTHPSQPRLPSL